MKKIFLFAIAVSSLLVSRAQSVTGDWEGSLNVNGAGIKIIFHIKKDSSGKLSATFDSPQQMAYGLACSAVTVQSDSVLIAMKNIGGHYAGLLGTDGKTMVGSWFQGGASLPLDMTRTSENATVNELKRPQTPKPPYGYASEDITYTNADASITFGATLTYPSGNTGKKYPAVILITGSGQEDRDESLFEHKPFAVIADYLTKKGFAVLRVDDRGTGKTTGNVKNATSADFAKDVEAGLDYLKTRKEVDVKNMGLIGHSEGGMIAPMVASRRKEIKFIVLLAGPGVPITDLMEQQTLDVMATNNISKHDLELFRPFYKSSMNVAVTENDSAIAAEKIKGLFREWQNKTDAATVKNTTHVTDAASLDEFTGAVISEVKNPWFNYFIRFKPAEYLSKLKCAVLALNGEKDIQVSAVPNTEAIRKIMVEKMVKTFKVQVLPGLNHLFQHCKTCAVTEYGELEETFAPEALQIMGDWMEQVTQ